MQIIEKQIGKFLISTDKSKVDIALVQEYLANQSYWAKGIPFSFVEKSIANSLVFGIYKDNEQVGFCRAVTDYSTFAWLCDVFIVENHRGQGLSKALIAFVKDHPGLQNLRNFVLGTLDAHGLYAQFGFGPLQTPQNMMQIKDFDVYKKINQEVLD
jgi:GNAT superfamily N-acetyltransferase